MQVTRDPNAARKSAPFITPKQLNTYLGKEVVIAGKVQSATDATIVINTGEAGNATVHRGTAREFHIDQGMNVMVRGLVNPDLSVAESNAFPVSDLGENFGTYVHS